MNNSTHNSDIIVALATPYGRSAIAAIRITGKGCIQKVNGYLARPLKVNELRTNVFNAQGFVERLTAVCFVSPKSYTGEDCVELFSHGNMAVCDGIIKTLIDGGMRAAERGEFTKRAFMNGKLDLMQCEALADIIDAQTAEQLKYGNMRYDGGFKSLGEAEKSLNTALSTVEAVLHYSDELESGEQEEHLNADVYGMIDGVIDKLKREIDGYAGGRIIKDGFKVALIGSPNVGKSTLLNALTDSDRAIVTPIAGTTRDTIDGEYVYLGRKFCITDTAGLTETDDVVEKIGVERAKKAAEDADAVIFVTTDGKASAKIEKPHITVINKRDDANDVGEDYKAALVGDALAISAKCSKNITALKKKLYDMCPKNAGGICNHRQYDCVVRALSACEAAKAECNKAQGLEIVAAALYDGYSAIQELYGEGERADEKVINTVFERFCVGK